MISLLLLQAAAATADCSTILAKPAGQAVLAARAWQAAKGGAAADQRLGLAYAKGEQWRGAAAAFEAAARALPAEGPRAGTAWGQAGNAWLAAGDAARARTALAQAIEGAGDERGRAQLRLDRARALVALGLLGQAQADLALATAALPDDATAWSLSAALALRQERVPAARTASARAVLLAPDDPAVLLQAGNVALLSGDEAAARAHFGRAARVAPNSAEGRAAARALGENGLEVAPPAALPPAP